MFFFPNVYRCIGCILSSTVLTEGTCVFGTWFNALRFLGAKKRAVQSVYKKKTQKTPKMPFAIDVKTINVTETGCRLGDRFREHLRDVEINDKDASNQSPDTSISLTTLNST